MPTVSKNIFWSTLTSLLQLYTGSAVFIVLAKLMSVNDFGILSFGFSLSALAVIVADFGFSLMVIKDYPGQGKETGSYILNSLMAKLILSLLCAGIFFVYLLLFYEGAWFMVGAIYILFAIVSSFTIYLQALLRVGNRFRGYTASTVSYAIAITLIVFVYWKFQLNLEELVVCLLGAKVVQLTWTCYLSAFAMKRFTLAFDKVSSLLRSSWSFGVFNILGIFYFMVDTQIISLYLGAREVAMYQSVFRIVLILMVFSDILSNVLLPYLSFKFQKRENITQLVSKIFLYLMLAGCSIFLAFTSFKSEVLTLLYTPEYQEAAILVLPFSIVLILRTVSSLLGNILTISNRQVYRVVTVGLSLVVSLGLNVVMIPKYGILAGAWVSVLVHLLLFGMYAHYCKKEIKNLVLLTPSVLFILTLTAAFYLALEYGFPGNVWVILMLSILWVLAIFVIMKRDDNLVFLQRILKEKGDG